MAQLFRKHEMMKEYETKYENNLLSLHICNSGTVFDREIACVKACFYFDRRHSLDEVVDSVSENNIISSKDSDDFLLQKARRVSRQVNFWKF